MDIIYSSFSFIQKFRTWASRLVFIAMIVVCILSITQNPFAISLIIIVLLILLALICEDKIIVYEDRLIYQKMYLLNFYIIEKKMIFFKDIKAIESTSNTLKDQLFNFLSEFRLGGYLWVYLPDGSHITIQTSINRSELIEIADIVNTSIMQNGENQMRTKFYFSNKISS